MSTRIQFFGPSQQEVWSQLAQETGGFFENGRFWKPTRVHFRHREWILTLDTYRVHHQTGNAFNSTVFTRLRAPFVTTDHIRFSIIRKSMFSDLPRLFGFVPLQTGDAEFDKVLKIQGSDPDKLQRLLGEDHLRELLLAQPEMSLRVEHRSDWWNVRLPTAVDILTYHCHGIVREVERLKPLVELFKRTLDRLCEIGAAQPEDPQFSF